MVVKFIYSITMFYEKKLQFLHSTQYLYLFISIISEDKQLMYEKSITIYHTYESGLFDSKLYGYHVAYVVERMGDTAFDY